MIKWIILGIVFLVVTGFFAYALCRAAKKSVHELKLKNEEDSKQ